MIKKITATAIVSCFLFTCTLAQPLLASVELYKNSKTLDRVFDGTFIPYSAGRITEFQNFGSEKVFVNIQDLHCHGEVQRNIAKVIESIDNKYGLKTVYQEGDHGVVDTSWLISIRNKKYGEKVIESLLDSGKLKGSEYYSIVSGKNELISGIEDKNIYDENINRLNKIIDLQDDMNTALYTAKPQVELLKEKYYNSRHKSFVSFINKYELGKINSDKYYAKLEKQSAKMNIDINGFENLSTYLELARLRKKVSFNKVGKELSELMALLKKKIPFAVYNALLNNSNNFHDMDLVYVYLTGMCKEYDIKVHKMFPELGVFLKYVNLTRKINPLDLVGEEKKLIYEIEKRLCANDTERDAAFLSNFYAHLKEYYSYKLTADGFEYHKENIAKFNILWPKYCNENTIKPLNDYTSLLNDFYTVNVKRNDCFIKNIINNYKSTQDVALCRARSPNAPSLSDPENQARSGNAPYNTQDTSPCQILKDAKEIELTITGGFHTSGLIEELKRRRISYIIITPNVTKDTQLSELVYKELMRQQSNAISGLSLTSHPVLMRLSNLVGTLIFSHTLDKNEINDLLKENDINAEVEITGNTFAITTHENNAIHNFQIDPKTGIASPVKAIENNNKAINKGVISGLKKLFLKRFPSTALEYDDFIAPIIEELMFTYIPNVLFPGSSLAIAVSRFVFVLLHLPKEADSDNSPVWKRIVVPLIVSLPLLISQSLSFMMVSHVLGNLFTDILNEAFGWDLRKAVLSVTVSEKAEKEAKDKIHSYYTARKGLIRSLAGLNIEDYKKHHADLISISRELKNDFGGSSKKSSFKRIFENFRDNGELSKYYFKNEKGEEILGDWDEILRAGGEKLSNKLIKWKKESFNELLEAFPDDQKNDITVLKDKIINSVSAYSVETILPDPDMVAKAMKNVKSPEDIIYLINFVYENLTMHFRNNELEAYGFTMPYLKEPKIVIRAINDEQKIKGVLEHEMIHYLVSKGVIKSPENDEILPHAVQSIVQDRNDDTGPYKVLCDAGKQNANNISAEVTISDLQKGVADAIYLNYYQLGLHSAGEAVQYIKNIKEGKIKSDGFMRMSGAYLGGVMLGLSNGDKKDALKKAISWNDKVLSKTAENTVRFIPDIERRKRILNEIQQQITNISGKPVEFREIDDADKKLRTMFNVKEENGKLIFGYIPEILDHPNTSIAKAMFYEQLFYWMYSNEDYVEHNEENKDKNYKTPHFLSLFASIEIGRTRIEGLSKYAGLSEGFNELNNTLYPNLASEASKRHFNSLPPYIQFLEAALCEGRTGKLDPRANPEINREINKEVATALGETAEARRSILNKTMPESYETVRDIVWPQAKKLIAKSEEDLKKMKLEDMAKKQLQNEQMMEQQAINKQVEEIWNNMTQEEQNEFIEAMQDMAARQKAAEDQALEDYLESIGVSNDNSDKAKQELKKQMQKNAADRTKDLAGRAGNKADGLQKEIGGMSDMLDKAGGQIDELGKQAGNLNAQAGTSEGISSESLKQLDETVSNIDKKAKDISGKTTELKDGTEDLKDAASGMNDDSAPAVKDLKDSTDNAGKTAGDLDKKSKEFNKKVEELKKAVDDLKKAAKDHQATIPQKVETDDIKNDSNDLSEKVKKMKDIANKAKEIFNDIKEKGEHVKGELEGKVEIKTDKSNPQDKGNNSDNKDNTDNISNESDETMPELDSETLNMFNELPEVPKSGNKDSTDNTKISDITDSFGDLPIDEHNEAYKYIEGLRHNAETLKGEITAKVAKTAAGGEVNRLTDGELDAENFHLLAVNQIYKDDISQTRPKVVVYELVDNSGSLGKATDKKSRMYHLDKLLSTNMLAYKGLDFSDEDFMFGSGVYGNNEVIECVKLKPASQITYGDIYNMHKMLNGSGSTNTIGSLKYLINNLMKDSSPDKLYIISHRSDGDPDNNFTKKQLDELYYEALKYPNLKIINYIILPGKTEPKEVNKYKPTEDQANTLGKNKPEAIWINNAEKDLETRNSEIVDIVFNPRAVGSKLKDVVKMAIDSAEPHSAFVKAEYIRVLKGLGFKVTDKSESNAINRMIDETPSIVGALSLALLKLKVMVSHEYGFIRKMEQDTNRKVIVSDTPLNLLLRGPDKYTLAAIEPDKNGAIIIHKSLLEEIKKQGPPAEAIFLKLIDHELTENEFIRFVDRHDYDGLINYVKKLAASGKNIRELAEKDISYLKTNPDKAYEIFHTISEEEHRSVFQIVHEVILSQKNMTFVGFRNKDGKRFLVVKNPSMGKEYIEYPCFPENEKQKLDVPEILVWKNKGWLSLGIGSDLIELPEKIAYRLHKKMDPKRIKLTPDHIEKLAEILKVFGKNEMKNTTVMLTGPKGSGKNTMVNLISSLLGVPRGIVTMRPDSSENDIKARTIVMEIEIIDEDGTKRKVNKTVEQLSPVSEAANYGWLGVIDELDKILAENIRLASAARIFIDRKPFDVADSHVEFDPRFRLIIMMNKNDPGVKGIDYEGKANDLLRGVDDIKMDYMSPEDEIETVMEEVFGDGQYVNDEKTSRKMAGTIISIANELRTAVKNKEVDRYLSTRGVAILLRYFKNYPNDWKYFRSIFDLVYMPTSLPAAQQEHISKTLEKYGANFNKTFEMDFAGIKENDPDPFKYIVKNGKVYCTLGEGIWKVEVPTEINPSQIEEIKKNLMPEWHIKSNLIMFWLQMRCLTLGEDMKIFGVPGTGKSALTSYILGNVLNYEFPRSELRVTDKTKGQDLYGKYIVVNNRTVFLRNSQMDSLSKNRIMVIEEADKTRFKNLLSTLNSRESSYFDLPDGTIVSWERPNKTRTGGFIVMIMNLPNEGGTTSQVTGDDVIDRGFNFVFKPLNFEDTKKLVKNYINKNKAVKLKSFEIREEFIDAIIKFHIDMQDREIEIDGTTYKFLNAPTYAALENLIEMVGSNVDGFYDVAGNYLRRYQVSEIHQETIRKAFKENKYSADGKKTIDELAAKSWINSIGSHAGYAFHAELIDKLYALLNGLDNASGIPFKLDKNSKTTLMTDIAERKGKMYWSEFGNVFSISNLVIDRYMEMADSKKLILQSGHLDKIKAICKGVFPELEYLDSARENMKLTGPKYDEISKLIATINEDNYLSEADKNKLIAECNAISENLHGLEFNINEILSTDDFSMEKLKELKHYSDKIPVLVDETAKLSKKIEEKIKEAEERAKRAKGEMSLAEISAFIAQLIDKVAGEVNQVKPKIVQLNAEKRIPAAKNDVKRIQELLSGRGVTDEIKYHAALRLLKKYELTDTDWEKIEPLLWQEDYDPQTRHNIILNRYRGKKANDKVVREINELFGTNENYYCWMLGIDIAKVVKVADKKVSAQLKDNVKDMDNKLISKIKEYLNIINPIDREPLVFLIRNMEISDKTAINDMLVKRIMKYVIEPANKKFGLELASAAKFDEDQWKKIEGLLVEMTKHEYVNDTVNLIVEKYRGKKLDSGLKTKIDDWLENKQETYRLQLLAAKILQVVEIADDNVREELIKNCQEKLMTLVPFDQGAAVDILVDFYRGQKMDSNGIHELRSWIEQHDNLSKQELGARAAFVVDCDESFRHDLNKLRKDAEDKLFSFILANAQGAQSAINALEKIYLTKLADKDILSEIKGFWNEKSSTAPSLMKKELGARLLLNMKSNNTKVNKDLKELRPKVEQYLIGLAKGGNTNAKEALITYYSGILDLPTDISLAEPKAKKSIVVQSNVTKRVAATPEDLKKIKELLKVKGNKKKIQYLAALRMLEHFDVTDKEWDDIAPLIWGQEYDLAKRQEVFVARFAGREANEAILDEVNHYLVSQSANFIQRVIGLKMANVVKVSDANENDRLQQNVVIAKNNLLNMINTFLERDKTADCNLLAFFLNKVEITDEQQRKDVNTKVLERIKVYINDDHYRKYGYQLAAAAKFDEDQWGELEPLIIEKLEARGLNNKSLNEVRLNLLVDRYRGKKLDTNIRTKIEEWIQKDSSDILKILGAKIVQVVEISDKNVRETLNKNCKNSLLQLIEDDELNSGAVDVLVDTYRGQKVGIDDILTFGLWMGNEKSNLKQELGARAALVVDCDQRFRPKLDEIQKHAKEKILYFMGLGFEGKPNAIKEIVGIYRNKLIDMDDLKELEQYWRGIWISNDYRSELGAHLLLVFRSDDEKVNKKLGKLRTKAEKMLIELAEKGNKSAEEALIAYYSGFNKNSEMIKESVSETNSTENLDLPQFVERLLKVAIDLYPEIQTKSIAGYIVSKGVDNGVTLQEISKMIAEELLANLPDKEAIIEIVRNLGIAGKDETVQQAQTAHNVVQNNVQQPFYCERFNLTFNETGVIKVQNKASTHEVDIKFPEGVYVTSFLQINYSSTHIGLFAAGLSDGTFEIIRIDESLNISRRRFDDLKGNVGISKIDYNDIASSLLFGHLRINNGKESITYVLKINQTNDLSDLVSNKSINLSAENSYAKVIYRWGTSPFNIIIHGNTLNYDANFIDCEDVLIRYSSRSEKIVFILKLAGNSNKAVIFEKNLIGEWKEKPIIEVDGFGPFTFDGFDETSGKIEFVKDGKPYINYINLNNGTKTGPFLKDGNETVKEHETHIIYKDYAMHAQGSQVDLIFDSGKFMRVVDVPEGGKVTFLGEIYYKSDGKSLFAAGLSDGTVEIISVDDKFNVTQTHLDDLKGKHGIGLINFKISPTKTGATDIIGDLEIATDAESMKYNIKLNCDSNFSDFVNSKRIFSSDGETYAEIVLNKDIGTLWQMKVLTEEGEILMQNGFRACKEVYARFADNKNSLVCVAKYQDDKNAIVIYQKNSDGIFIWQKDITVQGFGPFIFIDDNNIEITNQQGGKSNIQLWNPGGVGHSITPNMQSKPPDNKVENPASVGISEMLSKLINEILGRLSKLPKDVASKINIGGKDGELIQINHDGVSSVFKMSTGHKFKTMQVSLTLKDMKFEEHKVIESLGANNGVNKSVVIESNDKVKKRPQATPEMIAKIKAFLNDEVDYALGLTLASAVYIDESDWGDIEKLIIYGPAISKKARHVVVEHYRGVTADINIERKIRDWMQSALSDIGRIDSYRELAAFTALAVNTDNKNTRKEFDDWFEKYVMKVSYRNQISEIQEALIYRYSGQKADVEFKEKIINLLKSEDSIQKHFGITLAGAMEFDETDWEEIQIQLFGVYVSSQDLQEKALESLARHYHEKIMTEDIKNNITRWVGSENKIERLFAVKALSVLKINDTDWPSIEGALMAILNNRDYFADKAIEIIVERYRGVEPHTNLLEKVYDWTRDNNPYLMQLGMQLVTHMEMALNVHNDNRLAIRRESKTAVIDQIKENDDSSCIESLAEMYTGHKPKMGLVTEINDLLINVNRKLRRMGILLAGTVDIHENNWPHIEDILLDIFNKTFSDQESSAIINSIEKRYSGKEMDKNLKDNIVRWLNREEKTIIQEMGARVVSVVKISDKFWPDIETALVNATKFEKQYLNIFKEKYRGKEIDVKLIEKMRGWMETGGKDANYAVLSVLSVAKINDSDRAKVEGLLFQAVVKEHAKKLDSVEKEFTDIVNDAISSYYVGNNQKNNEFVELITNVLKALDNKLTENSKQVQDGSVYLLKILKGIVDKTDSAQSKPAPVVKKKTIRVKANPKLVSMALPIILGALLLFASPVKAAVSTVKNIVKPTVKLEMKLPVNDHGAEQKQYSDAVPIIVGSDTSPIENRGQLTPTNWIESVNLSMLQKGKDNNPNGKFTHLKYYIEQGLKDSGINLLNLEQSVDSSAGLYSSDAKLVDWSSNTTLEDEFGDINLLNAKDEMDIAIKEFEGLKDSNRDNLNKFARPGLNEESKYWADSKDISGKDVSYKANLYKYIQWKALAQETAMIADAHSKDIQLIKSIKITPENMPQSVDAVSYWLKLGYDGIRLDMSDASLVSKETLDKYWKAGYGAKPSAIIMFDLPGSVSQDMVEYVRNNFKLMRNIRGEKAKKGECLAITHDSIMRFFDEFGTLKDKQGFIDFLKKAGLSGYELVNLPVGLRWGQLISANERIPLLGDKKRIDGILDSFKQIVTSSLREKSPDEAGYDIGRSNKMLPSIDNLKDISTGGFKSILELYRSGKFTNYDYLLINLNQTPGFNDNEWRNGWSYINNLLTKINSTAEPALKQKHEEDLAGFIQGVNDAIYAKLNSAAIEKQNFQHETDKELYVRLSANAVSPSTLVGEGGGEGLIQSIASGQSTLSLIEQERALTNFNTKDHPEQLSSYIAALEKVYTTLGKTTEEVNIAKRNAVNPFLTMILSNKIIKLPPSVISDILPVFEAFTDRKSLLDPQNINRAAGAGVNTLLVTLIGSAG